MADEFVADIAVIIGIGAYEAVGRLETPIQDAEAVASLLASRFGYEVILQCDGTATLKGLRTLLFDDLPQRVPEGSRLLVYFAGHGVAQGAEVEGPQGYLVPYGASSDVKEHLAMSELYDALKGLPCRHLLVILDCCFSGSFRWATQRPMYVPEEILYEERYQHWVRHPTRWALASAAHDEYALDIPDRRRGRTKGHSPFAAALLQGLEGAADTWPQGGDGIVTLAELYAYVQNRLVPHQSPLLAPLPGQTRGEFVFRDRHRARPLVSAQQVVLKENENPYQGLNPYGAGQARFFFGRDQATRQLLRHVRRRRLTVVVGPSGSGKSSLVQAGLLPRLRARRPRRPDVGWKLLEPLRVTGDPFAALEESLAAAGGPPPPAAAELRDNPEAARAWAAAWVASHPCERLLIVVDQAEELITRVPLDRSARPGDLPTASAQFLACLGTLMEAGAGRLRALIAVRSDYEPDLDDGPLAPLWSAGRFVVPLLSRDELREVIEGPAARKALYFDDPALVERLIDEVIGMPGGLPLLSYALSRLYLAYIWSGRSDRLLTADDLAAIGSGGSGAPGGIVRILREEADRAVSELPKPSQETLWRLLLRMVNLVGTRPTRRQVPLSELDYPRSGENDRVTQVLQSFADKERLLVRDRVEDLVPGSSGGVELAHDELLVSWPELSRRIDAARERLPIHRRLTETATEWYARPERPDSGLDLRLLEQVEASFLPVEWLNEAEMEYLNAARKERRGRARLGRLAAAAVLLFSVGTAIFFYVQNARNVRLRYQSMIQSLINQAEADFSTGETARGLLLARQAFNFLPRSERTLAGRVDQLFRQVLDDLPPSRVVLRGVEDSEPVAFHPTGLLLVTSYRGSLVQIALPEQGIDPVGSVEPLPGLPDDEYPQAIAFSSDGRWLAAGFSGSALCLWSLTGTPPAPRQKGFCLPTSRSGTFVSLAFQPQAALLIAAWEDSRQMGSIRVWEVGGSESAPRLLHRSDLPLLMAISALTVSPAGEFFVSLHDRRLLRGLVADPASSLRPLNLSTDQIIRSLTLDLAGESLLGQVDLSGQIGQILRWHLPSGEGPTPVERQVEAEVFAVDSEDRLVTVDADRYFRQMSLEDMTEENRHSSLCRGKATALTVAPSGLKAAIVCDDVLRLWDLPPARGSWSRGVGQKRALFFAETTALAARPGHPNELAIGDSSGNIEIIDTETGEHFRPEPPSSPGMLGLSPGALMPPCPGRGISSLVWNPEGTALKVVGHDGSLRLQNLVEGPFAASLGNLVEPSTHWLGGCVCAAAGSADGSWLAIAYDAFPGSLSLTIWPGGGSTLLKSSSNPIERCKIGLAFHARRPELLVGLGTKVTLWAPSNAAEWQQRPLAEAEGRVLAAAWAEDLAVIGGENPDGDGFVEVLNRMGARRHLWTIPEVEVSGLAYDSAERQIAASTDGGGLSLWRLDHPETLPIVLAPDHFSHAPAFLGANQVAALSANGVSVWKVGTQNFADAVCATTSSNLPRNEWTSYVDPDTGSYEMACPDSAIGPDPSVLDYADSLAWKGNLKEARRLYRRLNKLKEGTVVNPSRRARGQQMASELARFATADLPGILDGMRRAKEYDALRQAEDLSPLPPQTLLRLCRWGILRGEPHLALPFCEKRMQLFPYDGMAQDSRGLARAILGDLRGAREDFIASRNWLKDFPEDREQRQAWIDALAAGRNPITPAILARIAREELGSPAQRTHLASR